MPLQLKPNYFLTTKINSIFFIFWTFSLLGQQDSIVNNLFVTKQVYSPSDFDSTSQKLISALHTQIGDSIEFEAYDVSVQNTLEKVKKLNLEGNIIVGQDYGLVTGYIDHTNKNNLNVLRSNGDIDISYIGIPVNFSYNYSTLRNPLGANNYFRFSLDTQKISSNADEKKNGVSDEIETKLKEVREKKGEINGKLGFSEVLLNMLKKRIEVEKLQLAEKQKMLHSKTIKNNDKNGSDSLNRHYSKLQGQSDSLNAKYEKSIQLYDSINKLYTKVKEVYELYSSIENQLNSKKMLLENIDGNNSSLTERALDSLSKRQKSFLSSIKTLDIGLTYPKTSGISKNSPPIKGLNIEIERESWYYAFAAGFTLNNTMISTDVIDNKLIYSENLFNQFDFQKITKNGFLVAAKTGYGKVESSHAHIGIRYLTNSRFSEEFMVLSDSLKVPSIALELDLRWIPNFSKNTTFDFVYGKTSSSSTVITGLRSNAWNSLFSKDRTNTGLFSIGHQFPILRTDVKASIRIIDPLADMRSLGVLQPNNIRYELKTNHRISSRLNLGFNYRHDRNNIDNKLDTTANLNLFGLQLGGSIGSLVSYSGNINYLAQVVRNSSLNQSIGANNYIVGFSVSTKYKIAKIENMAGINYNEFVLTNNGTTGRYSVFGLQNSTMYSKSLNVFSVNYFMSTLEDSTNTNSIIVGDDFSISKKRIKYTVGAKLAFSKQFGSSVGGKLECLAQLTNYMDILVRAERFVLGDFYNSYDRTRFDRFPYLITVQLNFKIK